MSEHSFKMNHIEVSSNIDERTVTISQNDVFGGVYEIVLTFDQCDTVAQRIKDASTGA